ncbi:hypothetical protein ABIA96_005107 [Bradyrhizobium sp. LB11.1]
MTKSLPYTQASLRRAILAVESAGKFVIGVRPDGTLIVGNEPFDVSSLTPANDNVKSRSKWEDVRG